MSSEVELQEFANAIPKACRGSAQPQLDNNVAAGECLNVDDWPGRFSVVELIFFGGYLWP
jgi:hypothetical protein